MSDVAFLSALIDMLVATEKVDPRRLYVTGIPTAGWVHRHRVNSDGRGTHLARFR